MKPSMLIIGAVVALLLVGLFFTASGVPLPQTRQLSNPEGSALDVTADQGTLLALLVLGVPALILGMAIPLYVGTWFFNREINRAQNQANQPVELLQLGAPEAAPTAVLANNAFMIVVGVGVLMVAIVVAILLATSL